MSRRLFAMLALLTGICLAAQPLYLNGKIAGIEKKTRSRVLYYQVNTPVTAEDPYYEVSVRLKNTVYVGEYTPRHSDEELPANWNAGAQVQVKLEKHKFFIKRPEGGELQAVIAKHYDVPADAPDKEAEQKGK